MNLYKLTALTRRDYDTWDSCVVMAESDRIARTIHPGDYRWIDNCWYRIKTNGSLEQVSGLFDKDCGWVNDPHDPEELKCELIGVATEELVASLNSQACSIVSSYRAG
jgi:hypothetical protein